MAQRSARIQIRFPDHLKKRIEEIAEEQRQSEGMVVVDLVAKALSVDIVSLEQRVSRLEEIISTQGDQ